MQRLVQLHLTHHEVGQTGERYVQILRERARRGVGQAQDADEEAVRGVQGGTDENRRPGRPVTRNCLEPTVLPTSSDYKTPPCDSVHSQKEPTRGRGSRDKPKLDSVQTRSASTKLMAA